MTETQNPLATEGEPAIMGPLTRWIRTILQVLGALIVAVPTATAAAGISAMTSAKVVGVMGGIVIAVSAVQNALNSQRAKAKKDAGGIDNNVLITILVLLAIVALVIWLLGTRR